ncbi:MAG: class I poly(R)-hydroxyalkanoic acid synthase, partial [Alphaproteobacteria bacterium]|nr:class I poly(R)-hydroxyalkanoic acid synthase [Alphaproteobacteria bacterium]
MAENETGTQFRMPDPALLSRTMAEIAERSQRLVAEFLKRQAEEGPPGFGDPLNVGRAFLEMTARMMASPQKMMEAQFSLWQDYMTLWQNTARRMMGEKPDPVIDADPKDRRFKHPDWQENEVFDFIKQSYLLTARWMQGLVKTVDGVDEKTAQKVDFYTRQFVDAMAPSNFVLTNPEVLRKT